MAKATLPWGCHRGVALVGVALEVVPPVPLPGSGVQMGVWVVPAGLGGGCLLGAGGLVFGVAGCAALHILARVGVGAQVGSCPRWVRVGAGGRARAPAGSR